jgi:hypothetical protein
MSEDYKACYHLLGFRREASYEEIRRAYRQAMRSWHPDRHATSGTDPRAAEEMCKEIGRAYRFLMHYYKQHGRLPPYNPPAAKGPEVSQASAQPLRPGERSPSSDTPRRSAPADIASGSGERQRRFGQLALVLGLAAVVGLFVFGRAHSPDLILPPPPVETPSRSVVPPPLLPDKSPSGEPARFFTIGSTPQEVYAVQGVPDRMEKDVWYYGEARVYFVDGKVDRWETTAAATLKATLAPNPAEAAAARPRSFFALGSTKAEVRAIQGTPTREQERVWEYGASRVYFDEQGRVTGWTESPFFALQVRR